MTKRNDKCKQCFVSTETLMGRQAFSAGFNDRKRNKPFRKEYEHWNMRKQLNYEKGRQFAVLFNKKSYKVNYKPCVFAQDQFITNVFTGDILQ